MACLSYGIGGAPQGSATACTSAHPSYEVVTLGDTQYCVWGARQLFVTPIHPAGDLITEDTYPMPLLWQESPPAFPNGCVNDANFVQIVGEWRDRTVCEVNLPAIEAADCPTATPPQRGLPLVFPTDFANPQAAEPNGTRYCIYPPHGAHYNAPNLFWYISGWRAVRIIHEEPEFEITKTLNNCQSFGGNANRCVYDIRIENHGGPYVGDIQIQDVTNQVVNNLYLFDANQNPFTCQEYSGPQPNTLDFSADTITSPRTDICTMENVTIDATGMDLTLLVQLGGPALSPPEAPLNCAAVVNWDGRPSGMAMDEYPSDCEPALPVVCEAAPSDMTFWARFDNNLTEPDAISGSRFRNPRPLVTLEPADMPGHTGHFARLTTGDAEIRMPRNRWQVTNPSPVGFEDGDFSIDMWVRYPGADLNSGIAPGAALIIDTRTPAGDAATARGVHMLITEGIIAFYISANGTILSVQSEQRLIRDADWHHITVTVDRSDANGGHMYVDGQSIAVEHAVIQNGNSVRPFGNDTTFDFDPTWVSGESVGRNNPLFIGRDRSGLVDPSLSRAFDIDEFEVFSRALTPAEVQTLATAPKCR